MDEIFDKVKEHAYKAKDEAAKITRQVMDKTNNIITQTKLNFALNETEGKIKEFYTEMGRKVYEKYQESGEVCECMQESCTKIDDLQSEVSDLRKKIAELKDSVKCPECDAYNKKTSSFCNKCGCPLADENEYQDVKTDLEDVVDDMKDKVEDVVDDVCEAMDNAVEATEEAVKKVVTIKAKKPENKDE